MWNLCNDREFFHLFPPSSTSTTWAPLSCLLFSGFLVLLRHLNFRRHGLGSRSLGKLTADSEAAEPLWEKYLQHPLRVGCPAIVFVDSVCTGDSCFSTVGLGLVVLRQQQEPICKACSQRISQLLLHTLSQTEGKKEVYYSARPQKGCAFLSTHWCGLKVYTTTFLLGHSSFIHCWLAVHRGSVEVLYLVTGSGRGSHKLQSSGQTDNIHIPRTTPQPHPNTSALCRVTQ